MLRANGTSTQQGQTIQANALNIYYEEYGSGEPLILIHGACGTGSMNWEAHLPILSESFRVIIPDLRGHGKTNGLEGEIRLHMLTDDIVAFIHVLGLNKRFSAAGARGAALQYHLSTCFPAIQIQRETIPGKSLGMPTRLEDMLQ